MKKIMFIFGTRPELIKMYPVIIEARKSNEVIVVNTGQHKEMVNNLLISLKLEIDYDLEIMEKVVGLTQIVATTMLELEPVVQKEKPDLILVHGDTAATVSGSLVAFYNQIKLGHVEAGLRTYNKFSPFPEEINRQVTGLLADFHFAPTNISKQNLLNEGIKSSDIFVVGNSAIDMLKYTIDENYENDIFKWVDGKKLILVTVHRRENIEGMFEIFEALNEIATKFSDEYKLLYPIHFNPLIREKANATLCADNIKIIEPLDIIDFQNIMAKSHLVLTDSGGIQEEAPGLGIPVLVLRDTTERPEGVEAGTLRLVGTKKENIIEETVNILTDCELYEQMSKTKNPFGDGTTSAQIMKIIDNVGEKCLD